VNKLKGGVKMYQNLKIQMAAHNVTIEQLSRLLKLHRNTIANKLDGGAFTIEEAFVIKDYLFRQFDLSYLFKRDIATGVSRVDERLA